MFTQFSRLLDYQSFNTLEILSTPKKNDQRIPKESYVITNESKEDRWRLQSSPKLLKRAI